MNYKIRKKAIDVKSIVNKDNKNLHKNLWLIPIQLKIIGETFNYMKLEL